MSSGFLIFERNKYGALPTNQPNQPNPNPNPPPLASFQRDPFGGLHALSVQSISNFASLSLPRSFLRLESFVLTLDAWFGWERWDLRDSLGTGMSKRLGFFLVGRIWPPKMAPKKGIKFWIKFWLSKQQPGWLKNGPGLKRCTVDGSEIRRTPVDIRVLYIPGGSRWLAGFLPATVFLKKSEFSRQPCLFAGV